MLLGTAKHIITPQTPVRLCGYATRTKPFESVAEDIYLRVHFCEADGQSFVFIYADLLWWNSEFVDSVRPQIEKHVGVTQQNIFFVASHNHSGPPTGNNFTPLLETYNADYAKWLQTEVLHAVQEAKADCEEVTVTRADGQCRLNVFRRVKDENGKIAMLPNYDVPADSALTVVRYHRNDGSLKGAILHYPCHANLSNENAVQPDYPGVALRMADDAFPNSVCLFLQGCTADLRPNSVLGKRFVPCGYEGVKLFAADFFAACQPLLCCEGTPCDGAVRISKTVVPLPLQQDFTFAQAVDALKSEDEATRQWAQKVLDKNLRAREDMEISRITIGGFTLYTFNAEVSQYYAAFARSLVPGAICAAYTNGMIGYICTAQQIEEGGYEPSGSALYFALAGTYPIETQALIFEALKKL